ncbi:hypothetical protein M407DRAFT_240631 [Tulasnella calospora MUT 4182]|uniref:Uncharacterized protein n=1 Tax=Tulasnella calospora MUT 4182 TaxID=1051891 RepID=A0A0C3MKQ9_9AGAM|nr:hypothetical protein M407DRAFT_240631 [Tulasnella calospora MUT 4182]
MASPATTTRSRYPKMTVPQDLRSYTKSLHEYTTNLWLQARENAERQAKLRAEKSSRESSKHKRNSSTHR